MKILLITPESLNQKYNFCTNSPTNAEKGDYLQRYRHASFRSSHRNTCFRYCLGVVGLKTGRSRPISRVSFRREKKETELAPVVFRNAPKRF